MPTFEITSPDGKTYDVTGPEGSTKEQALERVKAQHAAPVAQAPSVVGDVAKEGGKGLLRGFTGLVGGIADEFMQPIRDVVSAGRYISGKPNQQPVDPGYGSQIGHAAGIEPSPKTIPGKYAGTTAEVLGNPVSYLGPGSAALKVGAGAVSGLASEGAGQLTEGTAAEPYARVAGSLVGGTATATAAAERNLTKLAAQLPTREKIYDAANAGYDMLKKSNTRISAQGTQDLLTSVKNDLHAEHFREYLAPSTYRAIEELGATGSASIGDLDGVRRLLNRIPGTNPTDREAARRAIGAIDDYLVNVPVQHVVSGDPARDAAILKHAQGNWSLHKQLEQLEEGSIKGQHRAGVSGSGANRVNTARQEVRKILDSDKKSRGMSDAVKDKMEEIVMGTWLSNKARSVGKYAPTGPVSAIAATAAGFGAGAPAAIAVGGGGFLAKHLGEYLTDRQIGQLEQLMRAESPIGKPVARALAPAIAEQQAVPAAAAMRSALTSPLAADGP